MGEYGRLRGFTAQNMGGPKLTPVELTQFLGVGTHTFTAPVTGLFKFVVQGGGGGGNNGASGGGGGAGGYAELTRAMHAGETAIVVVGPGGGQDLPGGASSVTFADAKVVTADGGAAGGATTGGAGGTATGGDVNLTGGAGGGSSTAGSAGSGTGAGAGGAANGTLGGGGGCSANLPYIGSAGGAAAVDQGMTNFRPGRGAGGNSNVLLSMACGGFVFIALVQRVA